MAEPTGGSGRPPACTWSPWARAENRGRSGSSSLADPRNLSPDGHLRPRGGGRWPYARIMERRRILFGLGIAMGIAALAGFTGRAAQADPSTDLEGRWRVEKKDAIVLVEQRDGGIAGKVVWAKDRDGIKGDERLDTKNPRPELRSRKVLGLDILTGLPAAPDGEGWYRGGRIYNPKTGK